MSGPAEAEIEVIDGAKQTVDCGEHANKTYEAVPTKKPHYAVYLMKEDRANRYESKKLTE